MITMTVSINKSTWTHSFKLVKTIRMWILKLQCFTPDKSKLFIIWNSFINVFKHEAAIKYFER